MIAGADPLDSTAARRAGARLPGRAGQAASRGFARHSARVLHRRAWTPRSSTRCGRRSEVLRALGAQTERRVAPAHRVRARRLLPHRRPPRPPPTSPATTASSTGCGCRRPRPGRHVEQDAGRRLRRRGQAPHHARAPTRCPPATTTPTTARRSGCARWCARDFERRVRGASTPSWRRPPRASRSRSARRTTRSRCT